MARQKTSPQKQKAAQRQSIEDVFVDIAYIQSSIERRSHLVDGFVQIEDAAQFFRYNRLGKLSVGDIKTNSKGFEVTLILRGKHK